MDNPRIIHAPINIGRRYAVTTPITQYDYGYLLLPEGVELPTTYEIDFSNDEKHGTSLIVYGDSEGAEVPEELIRTGKDVYAFYYHVGDGYGKTEFTWRLPNKCRPSRDGQTPTPSQQSSIDQLIVRSNVAVETAEQSASDASASAQSAQGYAEQAETAKTNAQTYANNAQTSATQAFASASQASASATASAQSASQSAQIKADVEDLVEQAQGYAQASAQSASASANSASQAHGYAQSASASAQSASGYASSAQASANTASAKAQDASTSAQTASQKATESAQSASQALTYKTDAESAKTASQTAQGLAESARDSAISAKNDAEQAKADAESARDEAQSIVDGISGALDDKADIITDTASGSIASFSDGAYDLPLKSLVVDINPIQDLSNGDPSPENICPISGWTSVDVEQRGKNLLPNKKALQGNNILLGTDTNLGADTICATLSAGTYTLSVKTSDNTTTNIYAAESGTATSFARVTNTNSLTFTIENATNIRLWVYKAEYGTVGISAISEFQLEKDSTATEYEPYKGTSVAIDLGQTVYGGKLDVLSGELVIDRAMVDLGTLTWTYNNTRTRFESADLGSLAKPAPNNGTLFNGICSSYTAVAASSVQATNGTIGLTNIAGLLVHDDRYDNATAFKTAMSGVQLVYKLATSQTYQLTPTEVTTLLGDNTIWADTGDTEVEYRADTKLYIERLTAPDSADMVADANIISGQYFMVGNSLYKATANIANGGAIVVGTNCTRVSLAQALNEINA